MNRMTERTTDLIARRVPFVQATVVRAQCPTSTRPGDAAVVLGDGTIDGFVGGQCAEGSVRTAALEVLDSGESVLLRILPDGAESFPDTPGSRQVVNPCLSGGALEIFLEPMLPAPMVVVAGNTPIAHAVAFLAQPLGFMVSIGSGMPSDPDGVAALIVASHGRDEEPAIRAALDAGVPFIGLVASRVRGTAVLDAMELVADERRRVHTPVGLEIGARTAEEIALSIMAAVVRAIRVDGVEPVAADPVERPVEAVDPVCGMTVVIGPDTPHLRVGDEDHWFCNPGCRTRFAEEAGLHL